MIAKFTRGPWKIYGDWGIQPSTAKGAEKIFAQFSHDAECENTQEGFANAHLITAAPEMYTLLKAINDLRILPTERKLKELLAKARGE